MNARKPDLRRRRGQRGAAAIELAYGMITLTLVFTAGIHFADAMFIRQKMASVVGQATRVCALTGQPAQACVQQRVQVGLGNDGARCQPLQLVTTVDGANPDQVALLRVEASCPYTGGPWVGLMQNMGMNNALTLRADATMPFSP